MEYRLNAFKNVVFDDHEMNKVIFNGKVVWEKETKKWIIITDNFLEYDLSSNTVHYSTTGSSNFKVTGGNLITDFFRNVQNVVSYTSGSNVTLTLEYIPSLENEEKLPIRYSIRTSKPVSSLAGNPLNAISCKITVTDKTTGQDIEFVNSLNRPNTDSIFSSEIAYDIPLDNLRLKSILVTVNALSATAFGTTKSYMPTVFINSYYVKENI